MTKKKPPLADRLLDAEEVSIMTSIGRSTIFTMSRDGEFPSPLKLSKNRIAWLESEILGWIANRERLYAA